MNNVTGNYSESLEQGSSNWVALFKFESLEHARNFLYYTISEYVEFSQLIDEETLEYGIVVKGLKTDEVISSIKQKLLEGQYPSRIVTNTLRNLSDHSRHFQVSVLFLIEIDFLLKKKKEKDIWSLLYSAIHHATSSIEKLETYAVYEKKQKLRSEIGKRNKEKQVDLLSPAKFKAIELLIKADQKFSTKSKAINSIIGELSDFIELNRINLRTAETESGTQSLKIWLENQFRQNSLMAEAMKSVLKN